MVYVPVIVLGCLEVSRNGISQPESVFVTHAANHSRQCGSRLGIARQPVEKKRPASELASHSVPFWVILHGLIHCGNSAEKPMTTKAVHFNNFDVELSQPLEDRPDVVLIKASDGRIAILGDGHDPFTVGEYRRMDGQSHKELAKQKAVNCE